MKRHIRRTSRGKAASGRKRTKSLRVRYQELQILQDISQTLLTSLDLRTTLENLLDKTMSIGSFDLGIIRLLDPRTEMIEPAVSRGYQDPSNIEGHRKRVRDPVSGSFLLDEMSRNQPRVEENVPQCDGMRTLKRENIRSAVIVPVCSRDEVLGILQLGSRKPRKFRPNEIRLLQTIGSHMGIAVQKARLYEETQRNLEQMRALHEIGLATSSTLDLHAVLNVLMEKIDFFLPRTVIQVWLLNKEKGFLERTVCWNLDETEWKGREMGRTPPLIQEAFEGKAPVTIRDIRADPRILDPQFFRKHGLVSYLGVPMLVKDEPVGVLVFHTRDIHEFTNDEIKFLTTLAGQAAIAIHNSQLHEQTKNQAAELTEANQQLSGLLDELSRLYAALIPLEVAETPSQMIERAIDRLLEATGADAALFRILDQTTQTYVIPYQRGFPAGYLETIQVVGRGSAVDTAYHGEPIIAADISRDQRVKGKKQVEAGFHSCAFLPFKVRDEVRGVIHLASRKVGYFSEERKEELLAIARLVGIVAENSELFGEVKTAKEELEKANEDLKRKEETEELLKELSQDITSLDIESLLKKLTDRVREMLKIDVSDMRIFVEEKWRLVGISGMDPNLLTSARTGASRGRAGWIMKHRRPLVIRDMTQNDLPSGTTLQNLSLRGYLGVPLFSRGGEVMGILRALTYQPREFTQEDVDLLQQLANGAAIALENARLLEHIKNQAVQLEKANRVKDEFLGFVSHELRTPVNAVLGYVTMIRDGLYGEPDAGLRQTLDKIINRSHELLSMVNSLLEATRIEAGGVMLERDEVNLSEFLEEVRSTYNIRLDKELTLIWDFASDLPTLETDRDKLRHILQNLINNAIKYTDRGDVTISSRCFPGAKVVKLVVADTGIGIPKHELPFIFEMFRQVGGAHARSSGGVGLGLHIVKKFTELIGGGIEVQSEPGKGSAFTVTLPYESLGAISGQESGEQRLH